MKKILFVTAMLLTSVGCSTIPTSETKEEITYSQYVQLFNELNNPKGAELPHPLVEECDDLNLYNKKLSVEAQDYKLRQQCFSVIAQNINRNFKLLNYVYSKGTTLKQVVSETQYKKYYDIIKKDFKYYNLIHIAYTGKPFQEISTFLEPVT